MLYSRRWSAPYLRQIFIPLTRTHSQIRRPLSTYQLAYPCWKPHYWLCASFKVLRWSIFFSFCLLSFFSGCSTVKHGYLRLMSYALIDIFPEPINQNWSWTLFSSEITSCKMICYKYWSWVVGSLKTVNLCKTTL